MTGSASGQRPFWQHYHARTAATEKGRLQPWVKKCPGLLEAVVCTFGCRMQNCPCCRRDTSARRRQHRVEWESRRGRKEEGEGGGERGQATLRVLLLRSAAAEECWRRHATHTLAGGRDGGREVQQSDGALASPLRGRSGGTRRVATHVACGGRAPILRNACSIRSCSALLLLDCCSRRHPKRRQRPRASLSAWARAGSGGDVGGGGVCRGRLCTSVVPRAVVRAIDPRLRGRCDLACGWHYRTHLRVPCRVLYSCQIWTGKVFITALLLHASIATIVCGETILENYHDIPAQVSEL